MATLQGRVALVTGSTSGIGLGIAHGLAKRGCEVILSGFGDKDFIQKLETEFNRDYGVMAKHINADLSRTSEVEFLCDRITQLHPDGIDILINNAGFQYVSPVEEFSKENWDDTLAVMLTAPYQLIKKFLPAMKVKGWGRIINVSSVLGHVASVNKCAYVAAKHGLIGMTKAVGLEAAGSGVTCNALCPGSVTTPLSQAHIQTLAEDWGVSYEEALHKNLQNIVPTGAAVGVDQLADAAGFLCSDAAAQMTGSSLVMDGGWIAR